MNNKKENEMTGQIQRTNQDKPDGAMMEYVPIGNQDKLKLSVAIVQNLIATKTKSGATCSQKDALKFMAMIQAKRLNPFEGDAFLIGYDSKDGPTFSMVTAHQAFLKRAELHPEFDGLKSGVIVMTDGVVMDVEGDFRLSSQELVGGWATVYFKTRKFPMTKRGRLDRFQKQSRFWDDNPEGMIVKCMEADALRAAFPTMCGGLYLREEVGLFPDSETTTTVNSRFQLPEQVSDPASVPVPEPSRAIAAELMPAKAEEGKTKTIHSQFAEFLEEIKVSFDVFRKWAADSGNIQAVESIASLEECPGAVLTRLLKSKTGLTNALKALV